MPHSPDAKLQALPLSALHPNPCQPRQHFDPSALAELAESIRVHGILQPLTVRAGAEGWEIVAGERRARAAELAGLETVPCLVVDADRVCSALLALVENLQRQNLHYFEEAEAIAAYLSLSGATQEEAARALGKSPSALANKLRLLRLSPQCREALAAANLTERHARCLLRLEDEHDRLTALHRMASQQLSVARSEALVERMLAAVQSVPPAARRAFILKDVRLFLNSLNRGLRLVREAGVDVRQEQTETEEEILLTLRIPKGRRAT